MNHTGNLFTLTSFGESHGKALGGVIDGCPPGIELDIDFINKELSRRKPGQSKITTQRKEGDKVEFLSGIFEGKTTGTPLAFVIWNKDPRSQDYDNLRDVYRASHADYTYHTKYGIRDHRGGGRTSARITIARVVAGAVAKLVLNKLGITINAYTSQVGNIKVSKNWDELDLSKTENNLVRCPDESIAQQMIQKIETTKEKGDTIGGVITCVAQRVPAGLGEPEFDKLHAELGKAILSINAVKGFEIGAGFSGTQMNGSEHNDDFYVENDQIKTKTNYSGGVQGGISNGMPIYFNAAFKPVATVLQKQETVNIHKQKTIIHPKGRHDPCVLPRAVPIVEAMTAMVLLDFYLMNLRLNLLKT